MHQMILNYSEGLFLLKIKMLMKFSINSFTEQWTHTFKLSYYFGLIARLAWSCSTLNVSWSLNLNVLFYYSSIILLSLTAFKWPFFDFAPGKHTIVMAVDVLINEFFSKYFSGSISILRTPHRRGVS